MVAYFFMTRVIKLFSLLSVLIMLGVGLAACGGSSSSSLLIHRCCAGDGHEIHREPCGSD